MAKNPTPSDCTCTPTKPNYHCPWHGMYPGGEFCADCDEYRHHCMGCGDVVKHWEDHCPAPCNEAVT